MTPLVAHTLSRLQRLAALPRGTCADRRIGELLAGTPLYGAQARDSRDIVTAWAYLGFVL